MLRRNFNEGRKKAIKRVLLARRYRATGPASDVVEAVLERACYRCERCDEATGDRRGTDWHLHHRRPRGAGGSKRPDTNLPQNLGVLCPDCHRTVENYRADALHDGWLVPQSDDPAQVAVIVDRGSRIVYFAPDGTYSQTPPARGAR